MFMLLCIPSKSLRYTIGIIDTIYLLEMLISSRPKLLSDTYKHVSEDTL